jgi:hypothetical protein
MQNANFNAQTADAQQVSTYKICILEHTRSFTHDGSTFQTRVDLCDTDRSLIKFSSIRNAELFAQAYAQANGFKYIEIGSLDEPALGETFVELGIDNKAH